MKKSVFAFLLLLCFKKQFSQIDSNAIYKRTLLYLLIDEFNSYENINEVYFDSLLNTKLQSFFYQSDSYRDIVFVAIQNRPHRSCYPARKSSLDVKCFDWNSTLLSVAAFNKTSKKLYRIQGFKNNDIYSFVRDYYFLHDFSYVWKMITKYKFLKRETAIPNVDMKTYHKNIRLGKQTLKYNQYSDGIIISW